MYWVKIATPIAAIMLSACADVATPVEARRVAEGDFTVLERGTSLLIVEAGGRRISIEPPAGSCVDASSVRSEAGAFFVMIEDCALAQDSSTLQPGSVNGITTISLSDASLFGAGSDRSDGFDELATFLGTDAGRKGAGMGGDVGSVRILGIRQTDDALYVLVEDKGKRVAPVLGDRFWRAFTEVNGRAAIASLGVAHGTPMEDDAMLLHLSNLVSALLHANAGDGSKAAPTPG